MREWARSMTPHTVGACNPRVFDFEPKFLGLVVCTERVRDLRSASRSGIREERRGRACDEEANSVAVVDLTL